MKRRSQLVLIASALVLAAAIAFVLRPSRIPVQTVAIQSGPLQEIVEEEGKTRMHDHFVVASTVNGRLRRVMLDAGDTVHTGEILAWIDPAPIDPRQTAVLEARLNSARAAEDQAQALAARARADAAQAKQDLARSRSLVQQGIISREAFDKAGTASELAGKQLQATESAALSAAYQVEEAKAALLVQQSDNAQLPTALIAPADGRILRLIEQSEHIVAPGTPILEIGYTPRLEIVTDFLTRDAVRIRPGMSAVLTDWGGDTPIPAIVRTIEPGAFTKISALGVEEQRVNVICDFTGATHGMEDGYHVETRVIVWQGQDVLRVPSSAVFRSAANWAVFVVNNGKAHKVAVQIGHRGEIDWEVVDGLQPGDHVIVHPGAEVDEAIRVQESLNRD